MVYDNDGPIYSVLNGKVVNGVTIAGVVSDGTWDYVLGQLGYPAVGQYFCGTGAGTLNKGVIALPDFQLGGPCNCSEPNGNCVYSGDFGFHFLIDWPIGYEEPFGSWTGWVFDGGSFSYLAFNNSQGSTIPIGGWYNWNGPNDNGPGQQNPTLATNFVLTPF
jgi:hypothetical protein